MSGGFIPEPERSPGPSSFSNGGGSQYAQQNARNARNARTSGVNGSHGTGRSGEPLRSLTPRQEAKLRAHIDERLTSLERDERKNTFGSISLLLSRLTPLIQIILQIPPYPPWVSLRISYLLTLTGQLTTYITALPLYSSSSSSSQHHPLRSNLDRRDCREDVGTPESISEVSESLEPPNPSLIAGETMRQVIDFLEFVDKGWQAVLNGQGWIPPDTIGGGVGRAVNVDFGERVGVTERIRLRSIILSGRQKMLAWARTYGSFPGASLSLRPQSTNGGQEPNGFHIEEDLTSVGPDKEWEHEILGMWNETLEMLSHDLDQQS